MKKKEKRRVLKAGKHGSVRINSPEEMSQALHLSPGFAEGVRFHLRLVSKILELVKKQDVTHAELAKRVGTSRPRMTAYLNSFFVDASTDMLIRVLVALGYKIETIGFKKIAG